MADPQELRQHLQSLAQKIMADPATIARQAQAQKDEATNDQQTREKHLTEKMDFAKRDANAERMRERIEAMKAQRKIIVCPRMQCISDVSKCVDR